MYAIICYFLLDVRANQSGGTWVPWSIDSFEKYTSCTLYTHNIISWHAISVFSFGCSGEPVRRYVSSLKYRFLWKIHFRVLYICIISSHVRYYLLFSFGCSGEPVRRYVSSLKYRFLWKIHSFFTLYMHNIISCTLYLLFSFGCSGEPVRRYVSSLKYRFLWKIHSSCTLHICIISSHVRYNLLFSFGCSGEPVRRYVSSLKYRFLWKIHFIYFIYA